MKRNFFACREDLERIREILERAFTAHSATLTIEGDTMSATIQVGKTATAVLHEFAGVSGTGQELPPIGPVAYTSSDPTIATVDMATGKVTGIAPGTVTITGTDAGNKLTASDTVTVTPAPVVAQSATLVVTPD
jgi:hypothetical protein